MYEIIPNKLSTHGIGDDYVVQPKDQTLTGLPFTSEAGDWIRANNGAHWIIVDARVISDEGLSDISEYKDLIDAGDFILEGKGSCVICCGAGQSRSNAIALGILVKHFKMEFYSAWDLIKERVPIALIMPDHISKLKKLFNVTVP